MLSGPTTPIEFEEPQHEVCLDFILSFYKIILEKLQIDFIVAEKQSTLDIHSLMHQRALTNFKNFLSQKTATTNKFQYLNPLKSLIISSKALLEDLKKANIHEQWCKSAEEGIPLADNLFKQMELKPFVMTRRISSFSSPSPVLFPERKRAETHPPEIKSPVKFINPSDFYNRASQHTTGLSKKN